MTNTTNAAEKQIAAYARKEARRARSVGRVDPAGAERIIAAAVAQVARMRAAAGLTSSATAWI